MGDAADMLEERFFDTMWDDEITISHTQTRVRRVDSDQGWGSWKTRDEGVIRIVDMGNSHLDNTIKYLERNAKMDHPRYNELLSEWCARMDKAGIEDGYDR